MVNNWLRISHFMPSSCVLCGLPTSSDKAMCNACYAELPRIDMACRQCGLPISPHSEHAHCGQCQQSSPPFQRTLSAFVYAAPLSPLIARMKFSGHMAMLGLLGQLLCDELSSKISDRPDAILPVPLHPRRLRHRGFNQSIELARPIAQKLGIPLLYDAVERRVDTPAQTGLSRKQRQRNLRRAFYIREQLPYRHIAIVDDVITTGQTITALAKGLRKSGVEQVECWSLARALPGNAK